VGNEGLPSLALRRVKFGHSPLAEEFRAAFAHYRKVATAIGQVLRQNRGFDTRPAGSSARSSAPEP